MVIEEGAHAIAAIADDVAADVHQVPAGSLAKGHFKEGTTGSEVGLEIWHSTIVNPVLSTEYSVLGLPGEGVPDTLLETQHSQRPQVPMRSARNGGGISRKAPAEAAKFPLA